MSLWRRFLDWLFGPVPTPEPEVSVPVDVEEAPLDTSLEPLSEGDVVRTDDGALYSVLGVDEEGLAWCRPMSRLVGMGTAFQPRAEVFQCDAREGAHHRLYGIKHSFMETPS